VIDRIARTGERPHDMVATENANALRRRIRDVDVSVGIGGERRRKHELCLQSGAVAKTRRARTRYGRHDRRRGIDRRLRLGRSASDTRYRQQRDEKSSELSQVVRPARARGSDAFGVI
jgi:hypothetical protein